MSISLPDGTTIPTTSIKNFVEVTELQGSDCLLGIYDLTVGSGSKITFDNLVDSLINTGSFSGETDQVYDPTSENAQSGVAIAGALSGYVLNTDLATVATSGSYNDLSNKPTIPTVYNATLTIQKNGTNVQTFTANSSSNKTANITVPTTTSDLTNDSGFITNSAITDMQTTTNLVTSISSSSTDSEYPSAKCLYDLLGDVETLLQAV